MSLVVGILGFVPGVTTHYDDLSFAGHDSGAKLLGTFQVSILHNLVHLLFGIAGLALARTADGARTFLVGGGIAYLGLWFVAVVGGRRLAAREHRRQLAAFPARDRADRARLCRRPHPGRRTPCLGGSCERRVGRRVDGGRVALPVHGEHLGDDLERDLGRRLATEVEAYRPAHAVGDGAELLAPFGLSSFRAERADVERASLDAAAERGQIEPLLVHE